MWGDCPLSNGVWEKLYDIPQLQEDQGNTAISVRFKIFWPAACKKWMIKLLKLAVRRWWASNTFSKGVLCTRICNLKNSGWDVDGIFGVYTVWADIAITSVIFLCNLEYCYGLSADNVCISGWWWDGWGRVAIDCMIFFFFLILILVGGKISTIQFNTIKWLWNKEKCPLPSFVFFVTRKLFPVHGHL